MEHLEETPNYVTESEPETKRWVHDPISGTIAPDPPEPKPESIPEWKGLKERRARKKIEKAEQQIQEAKQALADAEQDYRDGAWEAFHSKTAYTTNRKLAAVEKGDVEMVEDE